MEVFVNRITGRYYTNLNVRNLYSSASSEWHVKLDISEDSLGFSDTVWNCWRFWNIFKIILITKDTWLFPRESLRKYPPDILLLGGPIYDNRPIFYT